MAFEAPVAIPNFALAAAPRVDVSWLANLPDDYFHGQQQQRALALQNAGRDTANPDGTPNFTALANRYMSLGALDQAGQLMQFGLRQKLLSSGGSLGDPLGRGASGSPEAAIPAASPAQAPGSRGVRDNNPGNMIASPWTQSLPGFTGTDGRFARFDTPEHGAAALDTNLENYGRKGISTPLAIASTWAPKGDGANDPQAYGSRIASVLGVGVNDPIDMANPDVRAKVAHAIRINEGTNAGAFADTTARSEFPIAAAAGPSGPSGAPVSRGASAQPPYRVASLDAVSAPSAPIALPASSPLAPNAAPGVTANSAHPQWVSPAEWAAKFAPNDTGLASKIADALGIDPNESIDVQDRHIRESVLPVLIASRRAQTIGPQSPTVAAGAPPQDGETPPGMAHPFGPERIGAQPVTGPTYRGGQTPTPFNTPQSPGTAAPVPVADPRGAQQQPTVQAPNAAPVPAVSTQPVMPSPDDAVPGLSEVYKRAGGGGNAQYLEDLLNKANQLKLAGLPADVQIKRAEQVQKWIEDRAKAQTEFSLADERANARARATSQYQLVETQRPDGTTVYVPKAQILNGQAGGGADGSPVVKSLPAYVTKGQSNLLDKLNEGSAAYQERQVAGERLDALAKLQEVYQTGANSTAFNEAAAKLRSLGIPVPNSAAINPGAMQQFAKDAYANVLSSMREQGNKQFVSEVQSAINSNPNPDLQPEANAAMISQIKGIQSYRDANYRDYSRWYHGNRGAADDADFQTGWAKDHPLADFVTTARREAAPLGVAIPPAAQRTIGQRYNIPGKGVYRWMGKGWTAE